MSTRVLSKPLIRRGGRPSKDDAGKLEDRILDAAAALFFSEGYGSVSIEEIVRRAQISKRTFYARHQDKAAIFRAVVHRIFNRLRPTTKATENIFLGKSAEDILRRIAPLIVHAALTPEALSLYRLVMAEAMRFPELATIMHEQGSRREAIHRIAEVLEHGAKARCVTLASPFVAAEQFLVMITAAPQRRALGFGKPMTQNELNSWVNDAIDLFLKGCWACTN